MSDTAILKGYQIAQKWNPGSASLAAEITNAIKAEREACAEVAMRVNAEQITENEAARVSRFIADQIRERSER